MYHINFIIGKNVYLIGYVYVYCLSQGATKLVKLHIGNTKMISYILI